MRIVHIADRPDLVDAVARWHMDEWGRLEPGVTLASLAARLASHVSDPCQISATFVALDGARPIGCVSVAEQTAEVFRASPRQRDLSPWLDSLYVVPAARRRGVGAALVRRCVEHVAFHGVARFYLFTDATHGARSLYESLGWRPLATDHHSGLAMTIMSIDPHPSPPFPALG